MGASPPQALSQSGRPGAGPDLVARADGVLWPAHSRAHVAHGGECALHRGRDRVGGAVAPARTARRGIRVGPMRVRRGSGAAVRYKGWFAHRARALDPRDERRSCKRGVAAHAQHGRRCGRHAPVQRRVASVRERSRTFDRTAPANLTHVLARVISPSRVRTRALPRRPRACRSTLRRSGRLRTPRGPRE